MPFFLQNEFTRLHKELRLFSSHSKHRTFRCDAISVALVTLEMAEKHLHHDL